MKSVRFEHEGRSVTAQSNPDEREVRLDFEGLSLQPGQDEVSGSVWLPATEARELGAYLIEFADLAEARPEYTYEAFKALTEEEQRAYVERYR